MLRVARVRGTGSVSPPTTLVVGLPWGEKPLSRKGIGIKMAGHVLQEATVDERLSKGQQMRFIPKAQKIIASTMIL